MGHLDKHHILTDFQHGFRHGRSCETQLILTVDEIAQALDKGRQIDCILLYFAKEFVKVSHKISQQNFTIMVSRGQILVEIQDFLMSRTQVVLVDGEESVTAAVNSGEWQGSSPRTSPVLSVYKWPPRETALPEKLHSKT